MELVMSEAKFELVHQSGNWVLHKEVGFSPVEALAASVGACGGYVYKMLLEKTGIPHGFEQVNVTFDRDQEKKTQPIKQVDMIFYISGVPADQHEKAQKLIGLIQENCPVIQSLDPSITVTEKVVFR